MTDLMWRLHSLMENEQGILECVACYSKGKHLPRQCPGIPIHWDGWNNWPEGLLTKKQLGEAGYTTGKKLPAPAALIPRDDSPDGFMRLYDPTTATPKREMSVAQVQALVAMWEANEKRSRCPDCGCKLYGRDYYRGICWDCEIHQFHENEMVECRDWARKMFEQGFVILDFETTGLDWQAEPVEVGVVDHLGNVLVDTLVKPTCDVSEGSRRVHGITDKQLADAPHWGEVYSAVFKAVCGQTVLFYAMEGFDARVFQHTCRLYHLPYPPSEWISAQVYWNAWCGEHNRRYQDWRWQSLNGGHRAVGDCQAVRIIMRKMAGLP